MTAQKKKKTQRNSRARDIPITLSLSLILLCFGKSHLSVGIQVSVGGAAVALVVYRQSVELLLRCCFLANTQKKKKKINRGINLYNPWSKERNTIRLFL